MKQTIFPIILLTILIFKTNSTISGEIPLQMMPEVQHLDEVKSQVRCNCSKKYHDMPMRVEFMPIEKRPYDVSKLNISIDWYHLFAGDSADVFSNPLWYANVILDVKILDESIDKIVFDSYNLNIDSVLFEGNTVQFTTSIDDQALEIIPGRVLEANEDVSFQIFYHKNIRNEDGFFLFEEGRYVGMGANGDTIRVEERVAYTQSEPNLTRTWVPCNDSPYDKSFVELNFIVPEGFTSASNGLLKNDYVSDGKRYQKWVPRDKMAPYLMVANASKFYQYSDWYKKVTNPEDSIEVQYYVWEKDYLNEKRDGTVYNPRFAFDNTVMMIEEYSKLFGEYPYEKYGMVTVQPYYYGGMEHQTLSTVNRVWLRGYSYYGIAHELAHQWFGDLITCASWYDIWINEGAATWAEALWGERKWYKDIYYDVMMNARKTYLRKGGLSMPQIYGLPVETIFGSNYVLVYDKASWIYHMLRENLGDDVYFSTLQKMLNDYKFQAIDSKQYQEVFEKYVPDPEIDFETFFGQWLYSAGHPVYRIESVNHIHENGSSDVALTLMQVQDGDNVPELFKTPLWINFFGPDSTIVTHRILNVEQNQVEYFTLPFVPDSLHIDIRKTLCEEHSVITDIRESNDNISDNEISIYPNPVLGANESILKINTGASAVKAEIYDEMGNKIRDLYNGNVPAGNYEIPINVEGMASGRYFIRTIINGSPTVKPFTYFK